MLNIRSGRWCIVLFFAYTSSALAQPPMEAPTPKVRAEQASIMTVQEKRLVTGDLRAVSRARIAALEEGRVIEVLADEAQEVKQGDLLLRIDDRRLNAQIDSLKAQQNVNRAQYEARKAELENAQWNLERLKPLWEKQLATEQDLKDAETLVRVKQAETNAAQRDLERIASDIELLTIRLADTRIEAPFDGVIVERNVELGEWIRPGDSTMGMVSGGTIEAWLETPEQIAIQFDRRADTLDIDIASTGETVKAKNVRVIPDANPRTRTMFIVADIDMNGVPLAPGMSVKAWIPTGKKADRLTVSKDALMKQETGFYVFKAQQGDDGFVAVPTLLERMFEVGTRTVVESPALKEDDLVIIEGNERLFPMAAIELIGQPTAAQAS